MDHPVLSRTEKSYLWLAEVNFRNCLSIIYIYTQRCRDSAQEVLQAYNASVLRNNFRKLVFFIFYLSENWVGVRTTAFARSDRSDGMGVPFEL